METVIAFAAGAIIGLGIMCLLQINRWKWEQNERTTFSDLHDSASDTIRIYRVAVKKSEERQGCKQQRYDAFT